MEKEYTKLSNLVNGTFTINKMFGYKWKMWDNTDKKMLVSDSWQKDYRKIYGAETDKGILDLSASQMGILLETVSKNGEANLNGRTFQVKSNGKTGMDIRYFFNAVHDNHNQIAKPVETNQAPKEPAAQSDFELGEINLDDIPF